MTNGLERAGLIEPINQPADLWFNTAVAQSRFVNQCCQQVSGCCQRVSAQLPLDELMNRFKGMVQSQT